MKNAIVLGLAALALVACGKKEEVAPAAPAAEVAAPAPAATPAPEAVVEAPAAPVAPGSAAEAKAAQ